MMIFFRKKVEIMPKEIIKVKTDLKKNAEKRGTIEILTKKMGAIKRLLVVQEEHKEEGTVV